MGVGMIDPAGQGTYLKSGPHALLDRAKEAGSAVDAQVAARDPLRGDDVTATNDDIQHGYAALCRSASSVHQGDRIGKGSAED
jgi:hypothetical protein